MGTVIFALMRGVLVKYLLHSKGEETKITAVHRARSYIRCLFQIAPHPPPWNIIFLMAELVAKVCPFIFKKSDLACTNMEEKIIETGGGGRKNSIYQSSDKNSGSSESRILDVEAAKTPENTKNIKNKPRQHSALHNLFSNESTKNMILS